MTRATLAPRPFPLLLDSDEAIRYTQSNTYLSDAELAYAIGICSREGKPNRELREIFGIDKVYTLTHLARVGKAFSDVELALWHNNPNRITLGHMRALAKLAHSSRESLLRKLIAYPMSVATCEKIARGDNREIGSDIRRYQELMSDAIGHPVSIKYNSAQARGSITLDFFNLDELDKFAELLGFNPRDHF